MHSRCRCTISAVVESGKRTAKVAGKNIRVPAEMKYADFKAVYIDKTRSFENWKVFHTVKIPLQIQALGAAVIPTAKLTQYALNPEKDANKARAFEAALGYNLDNVEKLIENVKVHIDDNKIIYKPKTQYGEPFQITMELTGENGKMATVTTGWIIDAEKGEIRLTSIYVDKKRG